MSDLSKNDIERASFAFSIYDFTGNGKIDAYNLGDVLRALNSNPTLATIEKLGGTKKKGEKQLSVEEFLPIYAQCKKDKDQGVYEDFLECLKLYDKNENGLMLAAELTHTLLALGEKLNDEEVAEVTKDCMDPEDDDGMIPYASFLKKLSSKKWLKAGHPKRRKLRKKQQRRLRKPKISCSDASAPAPVSPDRRIHHHTIRTCVYFGIYLYFLKCLVAKINLHHGSSKRIAGYQQKAGGQT
ncbi:unnamed protein product [Colias eurytheme]|nr:unnamed protein product [Colias eurytheme]